MTVQCNGAYSNKDSYPLRRFETRNQLLSLISMIFRLCLEMKTKNALDTIFLNDITNSKHHVNCFQLKHHLNI